MITLFKSKYRKRIEKAISELKAKVSSYEAEQSKHNSSFEPREYCGYSVKINDTNKQIEILERILNPY